MNLEERVKNLKLLPENRLENDFRFCMNEHFKANKKFNKAFQCYDGENANKYYDLAKKYKKYIKIIEDELIIRGYDWNVYNIMRLKND